MGFGRAALMWRLGVPLPNIIMLALFWKRTPSLQKEEPRDGNT